MDVLVDQLSRLQKDDLIFHFWCSETDENALLVESFHVNEGLFELTSIEASLVSHDHGIDLHNLIDAPATITVMSKYHPEPRYFSGVIAEAVRNDEGHHRTSYEVIILPKLHRLQHGSDSKIFQAQDVPSIVQETLDRYGIKDTDWRMVNSHEKREYCVQYRENHYDFLTRVCGEEGIFFFWKHGPKGKHTLVFRDDSRVLPVNEYQDTLEYNATSGGNVKGFYCQNFSFRDRVRSTKTVQRDYTFKNPGYKQQHSHSKQEDNGSANEYEWYDFPGRYKYDAAGKPFTQNLMESIRVDASTGLGSTNSPHMHAGHKFTLEEHDLDKYNIKYLILSASFSGSQPGAWEEDAPDDGMTSFTTQFKVMPSRLPYKPPQKNRPVVDGPQIAHVVGPKGEEIYTDKWGRIKLHFRWNRYCEENENSSCWIRVAQNWAGPTWGHIAIPRIGQEVIVDFLEGDPDQPIVTGRTYHAANLPPYELPKHKTRMTIKSDTHKGQGFNELRFEDEAGEEEVFIHAEKDMNEKIENNFSKRVNVNKVESIGHNKAIEVTNNHHEIVGGDMRLFVGPSQKGRYTPSGADENTQGIGGVTYGLGQQSSPPLGEGTLELAVEKNKVESIGKNHSQLIQNNKLANVKNNYNIDVGNGLFVDVGEKIIIKCGATVIKMTKDGSISINGNSITLTGKEIIKLISDVVKVN